MIDGTKWDFFRAKDDCPVALKKNEDYPRFCLYRAVNDQPDQLYIGILAVHRLFVYFCS